MSPNIRQAGSGITATRCALVFLFFCFWSMLLFCVSWDGCIFSTREVGAISFGCVHGLLFHTKSETQTCATLVSRWWFVSLLRPAATMRRLICLFFWVRCIAEIRSRCMIRFACSIASRLCMNPKSVASVRFVLETCYVREIRWSDGVKNCMVLLLGLLFRFVSSILNLRNYPYLAGDDCV